MYDPCNRFPIPVTTTPLLAYLYRQGGTIPLPGWCRRIPSTTAVGLQATLAVVEPRCRLNLGYTPLTHLVRTSIVVLIFIVEGIVRRAHLVVPGTLQQ